MFLVLARLGLLRRRPDGLGVDGFSGWGRLFVYSCIGSVVYGLIDGGGGMA